mmetsp:Transcript_13912/g.20631  ORF Transcript_13912/g.20631 Transcript_13912/m.20631 type:complete len:108 (+) Transcript_13912:21-344(+)
MSLSSSTLLILLAVFTNLLRIVTVCPDTGISDWSNTYCCPDSCGKCGSEGCHLQPGGSASCCTYKITKKCDVANLPCIRTDSIGKILLNYALSKNNQKNYHISKNHK